MTFKDGDRGHLGEHNSIDGRLDALEAFPPGTPPDPVIAGFIGDPASATATALSATYVAVVSLSPINDSSHAISNVSALNDAITAAHNGGAVGRVIVNAGGVYQLSGSVLMRANVTLDLAPGVTLRKIDGAPAVCMIRNANVSDVKPYADDRISIVGGGTIDCNPDGNPTRPGYTDPVPASGTLEHGIVGDLTFYGVSNLDVSGIKIMGGHGSCIQMMGEDLNVSRVYIATPGDGFHLNGPSRRVNFSQITGWTLDDFIAILPWDWTRTGPTVGDIEDVNIDQATYFGAGSFGPAGSATIKMVPGTRADGYGAGTGNLRNVLIRGLNFSGGSGVQIQSEFDQITGANSGAGTVENLKFDGGDWGCDVNAASPFNIRKLTVGGTPADGQTALTLRNIVVDGVHFDSTINSSAKTAAVVSYAYTGLSMQGVVFRDCSWTPSAAGGGALVNVQSKSIVDSLDVDGLTILGNMTSSACILTVNDYSAGNATTLKHATLNRLRTAQGVTVDSPIVSLSGVLSLLTGSDWDIQHAGGTSDNHGIWYANANASIGLAQLTRLTMRNAKEMFRINAGATGSVICRAVLVDCALIGVTHPIYIQGGRQADITFRGGNIDTPGNLARVDASTLTLTLDGTTSSGVAAAVITRLTTATVHVVRSDRIALDLSGSGFTYAGGDYVNMSTTPASVSSGSGSGVYLYGSAGFVKLA